MTRFHRLAPPLLLALALLLPSPAPSREIGYSPAVHDLVGRVRLQAPTRSLLDLGRAHFRSGDFVEAAELFTFALVQAPEDGRILWALARTHARLGNLAEARLYVGHLLQKMPESARAQRLDRRLAAEIAARADSLAKTPEAPPSPANAEPEAAGASAGPTTTATCPSAAVEQQKMILACRFEDKLACLRVLKGLDAAVAQYAAAHPDAPLKTLDLDLLRKEGILPASLRLDRWKADLKLDGKSVVHGTFGGADKLETEVSAYRNGLVEIARFQKQGDCFEAFLAARRLAKAFPDDGEACRAHVHAMTKLGETGHALKRLDALVARYPDDPALLYRRALLAYRTRRHDETRAACEELRRRAPKSYYARLAEELLRALAGGISFETLDALLAVKNKHFKAPSPQKDEGEKAATKDGGEGSTPSK